MSNIEFSNLNKSFGKNKIITDFNLKGKEDEFLFLLDHLDVENQRY